MSTLTEFEFIEKYLSTVPTSRSDVRMGIGDDAALVEVPKDQFLAITTDNLIEGRHFLPDTPAHALGYRLLAVNLSDLAAMGAEPAWASLSLTLPALETAWIDDFFQGFQKLANTYSVALIGGNTTQGACNLGLQLMGFVPKQQAIMRNGAKVGDKIVVTGTLGDAALALRYLRGQIGEIAPSQKEFLLQRLYYPTARVELGIGLRDHATAAIDISDGLAADLMHLLNASKVGAQINIDQLPCSPVLRALCKKADAVALALYQGDNYELCFTLPAEKLSLLQSLREEANVFCTVIGEIIAEQGLFAIEEGKAKTAILPVGWDHFMDRKT